MTPSTSHSGQAGYYLLLTLMATLIVSAIFHASPSIDMTFSHYFFDGEQFPLKHNAFLQGLREANFWGGGAVISASIILVISPRLRNAFGIRVRSAIVPLVTYGLGVGLIVNAFLKETFGRARPRDTIGLGGDNPLSAAWEISGACVSNCSFTSGEAAGAMAMISLVYLIPAHMRITRAILQISLGMLAIALSINRVAFGGHYLSDVVLSALIVASVMFATELLYDKR